MLPCGIANGAIRIAHILALTLALLGVPAAQEPLPVAPDAAMTSDVETDGDALIAMEVADLSPKEAMDEQHLDARIRWAGAIHYIGGTERGDCLTILYARIGAHGGPHWTQTPTYQNFVACGVGRYDPDLVHEFSNITIIGRVTGKRRIGLGGGYADGPEVEIEHLFRWSDCLVGDESPVCYSGFLKPRADNSD